MYDLLITEQISVASFDALLLLHQTRVELNQAARQELYLLPNLDYAQVDRILAYRNAVGSIESLNQLIEAGAVTPDLARSMRAFIVAAIRVSLPHKPTLCCVSERVGPDGTIGCRRLSLCRRGCRRSAI